MTRLHLFNALHGPRCHSRDDEFRPVSRWNASTRHMLELSIACFLIALAIAL